MGASALFPQIAPELAFPAAIKKVFPPWPGSIVLAAPLAALVAVIGGGVTALISKIWSIAYLDVGGLFLSGVLLLVVSLISSKMKGRLLDAGQTLQ